jgi:hypothetical protein
MLGKRREDAGGLQGAQHHGAGRGLRWKEFLSGARRILHELTNTLEAAHAASAGNFGQLTAEALPGDDPAPAYLNIGRWQIRVPRQRCVGVSFALVMFSARLFGAVWEYPAQERNF